MFHQIENEFINVDRNYYYFLNIENFSSPMTQSANYHPYNSNQINILYEYDRDDILNNISQFPSPFSCLKQTEIENTIISKNMKSTTIKTKKEEYNEPKLYTSDEILNIFNEKSNQISEDFKK